MTTGFAPEAFRAEEKALYFFSVGIETSMSGNFARFYDPGHGFAYSGITGTVVVHAGLIVAAIAPRISELMAGVHRRAAWVQNTQHSSTI
ncbi:hypothetical protein [Nocardia abscessus]|uniref:hypothetical protein n=1 Tax=Nocardia abscessus TaxID=120957 RepID=UPI0024580940|nr:hypothetical protein [Nocardia abscessus]